MDANRPISPSSRKSSKSRKPSVAIVGAGRLGTALASALDACGYEVRALVSREGAGARRAASRAGLKTLALGAEELERLPKVELLFIATPDDALEETAHALASLKEARARVALHTSGALSSEVLAPLRERGYAVGSMHPLAAISETRAGARSLREAFYCVEGDAAAVRAARRVVRSLGGQSFKIDSKHKALYHASALITAGHTVALFDIAASLLARCGLREREARRVLLQLLRSAVENLARQTPERALTGTFARGDAKTVRKHLAALVDVGDAEALSVYTLLGRRSLRLSTRVRETTSEEIERLLKSALTRPSRGGSNE